MKLLSSSFKSRMRSRYNNTKSSPKLSSKSVHFAPTVRIKRTLSHKDMTQEEKHNSWIQEEEGYIIRQRCERLIRTVEEFGIYHNGNGKTKCVRGLESHFQKQAHQKKMDRLDTRDEVLYEQEEQYSRGYYDAEAIAAAYKSAGITNECQSRAQFIAIQDQKVAAKYLNKVVCAAA